MGGFDTHRTPEASVVADCVHCGFCLDACPTYTLWAHEPDSPRGRIVLIADALQAEGPPSLSAETVTHLDRCLGCMACVTACPSGVAYDRLIERARPQVERLHRRSPSERAVRRLLFETLPHPARLRALMPALAAARRLPTRRLPERLELLTKVAPRTDLRAAMRTRIPEHLPAHGPSRGRVAVLLGCVQRVFYPAVHVATMNVLAAEGFDVFAPPSPDCCGALELHSGEEEAAIARARKTVAALSSFDRVVVSAAGCGSAMKGYGDLLDDPTAARFASRVCDVSELLAQAPPRSSRGRVELRVAYHDACHLAHAQGIRAQPRELLAAIPGLELLEVASERDICCGSAGIYNIVQPEAAAALGQRKAQALLDTGAQAIAAGNPGCAAQLDLHLRELGHPLEIVHPVELIWRSLQAALKMTSSVTGPTRGG